MYYIYHYLYLLYYRLLFIYDYLYYSRFMIRIVVPFLFMIYDSSSNQISDFCIFTFFRNLPFFTNPYISHGPYKPYESYRFYKLTDFTDNVPTRVVHLTDNVPTHLNNTCSSLRRRGAASHWCVILTFQHNRLLARCKAVMQHPSFDRACRQNETTSVSTGGLTYRKVSMSS